MIVTETTPIPNVNAVQLARALADEIAKQIVLDHWQFWVLLLLIGFLYVALHAGLQSFFQKRGETLATKADIHALTEIARTTTHATEQIRTQFDKAGWVAKETNALQRAKLEELLEKALQIEPWLDTDWLLFCDGKLMSTPSPLPRLEMLIALYFPELKRTTLALGLNAMQARSVLIDASVERLKVATDPVAKLALERKAMQDAHAYYQPRLKLMIQLTSEARTILEKLTTDDPPGK